MIYREQVFFVLSIVSKNVIHQDLMIWLHSLTFFARTVWHCCWAVHYIKPTFLSKTTTDEIIFNAFLKFSYYKILDETNLKLCLATSLRVGQLWIQTYLERSLTNPSRRHLFISETIPQHRWLCDPLNYWYLVRL